MEIDAKPYFEELNEDWQKKCAGKRLVILDDFIYWEIRDDYKVKRDDERKFQTMFEQAMKTPPPEIRYIQNENDKSIATEFPQFTSENCLSMDLDTQQLFTAGLYCTETRIPPEQEKLFLGTASKNPANPNMISMLLNSIVKQQINEGIDKSYDNRAYFYFMNAYRLQSIWGETAETAKTLRVLFRMPIEVQRLGLQIRRCFGLSKSN